MLAIDNNEKRNQPELCNLLAAAVPVTYGDYNQTSGSAVVYPDFTIFDGDRLVGVNRKTVGEWLGSSDKVIDQVQRELAGPCEQLILLIEGVMRPAGSTAMWGYSLDWDRETTFRNDEHGSLPYSRRQFSVNPKHAQNEQTRLEFLGVQVVHTYSIQDTASKLIAFHDLVLSGMPNNVLNRLIKADISIFGLTPQETKFARQLMSFDSVGEQVALTIAASFGNLMELIDCWSSGGTIADMVMKSGTRRIGDALERKLQASIGWTPVQSQQPDRQEDTKVGKVSSP